MEAPEPEFKFLGAAACEVQRARCLVCICVEQREGGVRQVWQRVPPEVVRRLTGHNLCSPHRISRSLNQTSTHVLRISNNANEH